MDVLLDNKRNAGSPIKLVSSLYKLASVAGDLLESYTGKRLHFVHRPSPRQNNGNKNLRLSVPIGHQPVLDFTT